MARPLGNQTIGQDEEGWVKFPRKIGWGVGRKGEKSALERKKLGLGLGLGFGARHAT